MAGSTLGNTLGGIGIVGSGGLLGGGSSDGNDGGLLGGLLGGGASGGDSSSGDDGGLLGDLLGGGASGGDSSSGDDGGLLGGVLGGGGDSSGGGLGGVIGGVIGGVGDVLGVPATADPDHLLGGLTMVNLLGLDLSLLGNTLLGTGISLGGQSLTLPTGFDVGGILGTDQADIVNLGAVTHVGSVVLGAGDDTFLAPVTSTLSGILDAGDGNDTITIGTGDATLRGGAGNDTLTATGSGDNVIDGGAGADTMSGGAGNDTYYVDNSGDRVIERPGEGNDTVYSSVTFSMAGQEIETLHLTGSANINGTGNELANTITGNDGANRIDGAAGADHMAGGLGNDTYVVDNAGDVVTEAANAGTDTVLSSISYTLGANVEHLTLTGHAAINATGNSLANVLIGNDGANVLDGLAGADTMTGGAGNDTYHVDNAGDHVVEVAGGGSDTVISSVSFAVGTQDIETVRLTGTANTNATGNALANDLTGNDGNNRLDGGAGADHMTGGKGDDTYYVDDRADTITEKAGQGTDQVLSSVSFSLNGAYVEKLTLTGSHAINGNGNSLANTLTGNDHDNILKGFAADDHISGGAGNDTIIGGAGQDTMTGGTGADHFVFDTGDFGGRVQSAADVITDFSHDQHDKIDLSSIDADITKAGLQHFTFIGDHAFTGAGQIRVDHVGDDIYLVGTVGANPNGDFKIHLDHVHDFTAADMLI